MFEDLPWTFKLSGSYKLPYSLTLAANYQARAGDPLERTLVVDRLAQGSDTIFVQQRGIDRVEPVKGLLDFRFSKQIAAGVWHVEPVFDIYNVFNANPVLAQNVGIGSTLGVPTLILAPRVIRLSIKVNF